MLCGCYGWRVVRGCRVVLKHITPLSFGEGLGVRLLGLLGLLGLLLEQLLLIYKQHILAKSLQASSNSFNPIC